jgi:hypothetical protein
MGFLQICAGVVLLQLSKSAKEVPDSAVLKGDLDEIRTVAEVEEPEYEPRADTIRGGAAILRSMSRARTEKQHQEVKRMHEESMEPVAENEVVEWDGLRRRKTVLDMSRGGSLQRRKTIHPPLGMTQFPSHDDSDDDSAYHPGFFQRLRSRGKSTSTRPDTSVGLSNLGTHGDGTTDDSDKNSYKADLQSDTSYKPHETTIHFAPISSPRAQHATLDPHASRESLRPPKPPPHTAKRQFSFQNVFHRNRAESTGEGSEAAGKRPTSRHSRKSSRDHAIKGTEEERLGLVKGDSHILLPIPSRDSREPSPAGFSDTEGEWEMPRRESPGSGSGLELQESPERIEIQRIGPGMARRVDTESSVGSYEKDFRGDIEKQGGRGGGGGAFL